MGEVKKQPNAFSTDRIGLFRQPRIACERHLEFIRSLPSILPGEGRIDPAHIRYRAVTYAKRGVGRGERPDDCWVVPLHRSIHEQQHSMNEQSFWRSHGIDPCLIAALLWLHSGNQEAATIVIANAKSIGGFND